MTVIQRTKTTAYQIAAWSGGAVGCIPDGIRPPVGTIGTPENAIPIYASEGAIAMGVIGIWGSWAMNLFVHTQESGDTEGAMMWRGGSWGAECRWDKPLWGLDTTSRTSDRGFVTTNGPLAGRLDRPGLEVCGCLLSDRLVRRLSYDSPLHLLESQPFWSHIPENQPAYMYLCWSRLN